MSASMSNTNSTAGRAVASGALAGLILWGAGAASARAASPFACGAWPTQTCHFALVRAGRVDQRFTLRAGEVRTLDVAPGEDAYMMSVNFDPPEHADACSRAPRPELKRSRWCELRPIRPTSGR